MSELEYVTGGESSTIKVPVTTRIVHYMQDSRALTIDAPNLLTAEILLKELERVCMKLRHMRGQYV